MTFMSLLKKYSSIIICLALLISACVVSNGARDDMSDFEGKGKNAKIKNEEDMLEFYEDCVFPLLSNHVDGGDRSTLYSGFTMNFSAETREEDFFLACALDIAINEEAIYWCWTSEISEDGDSGRCTWEGYASGETLYLRIKEYTGSLSLDDLMDVLLTSESVAPIQYMSSSSEDIGYLPQNQAPASSDSESGEDKTYDFEDVCDMILDYELIGRWVEVSNDWYFPELKDVRDMMLELAAEFLEELIEMGVDGECTMDYSDPTAPSLEYMEEGYVQCVVRYIDNTHIDEIKRSKTVDLIDYTE